VADILLFQRLQQHVTNWHKPRAKVLVLVPYLSIGTVLNGSAKLALVTPLFRFLSTLADSIFYSAAAERCSYIQELCRGSRINVKGYHKDTSSCPLAARKENIAVCSYEKGNSAINRLIAKNQLKDLCCVVVDEFHMIVDESRGSILEVCPASECAVAVTIRFNHSFRALHSTLLLSYGCTSL
jgi:hypothetical protein